MARVTIKLNLKSTTFFQPKQLENTELFPQYDQKQGVNQTKILHQINCTPLEHGIKSANLHDANIANVFFDENSLPTDLNLGDTTEFTTMIDNTANLWYMILDKASGQFVTDVYMRATVGGSNFFKYATLTNATRYEYNIHTVFQNRTLIAGLPTTAFHVTTNAIPHPDAVGPANGTLYDIDLTANEINAYDLLNIGADVLAAVQCIVSFNNYMIMCTRNRIYWSCPTDPYDFTPTDNGGGSEAVAEVRGDILAVLPSQNGFILYCRQNIVVARFTGSTAQPWVYNEIKGSSGLVMKDSEALLVKNETNQIHYALLVGGLSIVTEDNVTPVADSLRRFITNDFIETRVPNSGRLIREDAFNTPVIPDAKIKKMYSYGTKLFFIVVAPSAQDNRLYIYDVFDDSIAILIGDYIAVSPRLTDADSDNTLYLQQKVSAIPDSFVLMRKVSDSPQEISFEVLDFGSRSNLPVLTGSKAQQTAEFLVGDISLDPDYNTVLYSVKLHGRLDRLTTDEGGDLATSTTKVRVFAYSENLGSDMLIEFLYNPTDNTYYGQIEGPDIRILVQGDYFYLTGMDARVERGILN